MRIDTEVLTSFIPEDEIFNLLTTTTEPDPILVRDIIQKSLDKNRLDPADMAVLINTTQPDLLEEIYEGARTLKERVYGNRIVLFAPLYVGNECINECQYCAFRRSNDEVIRKTLSESEMASDVRMLVNKGHKRLIMVYGEHNSYNAQYIADTVRNVYSVKEGNGEIRRVNINAAPMDIEGFKTVKINPSLMFE